MAWGNEELARLFSEMAELLELTGETGFRVRAYDRGARALSGHGADLTGLSERELAAIPGVGKAIAAKVREYLDTVRVPGLGPAKARLVHERLGVSSPEELAEALAAGRVAGLPGMGARTEANLRRALERMAQRGDGIPLALALPLAETLRDLLAASTDPAAVNQAFTELPQVAEVAALGDTKASVRTRDGLQVDLRTVRPEVWGAAWQYFTGSAAHNVRIRERAVKAGLKLSEYGLFERGGELVVATDEEVVYARLGMAWVPPVLREDRGEVDAARRGELPRLVALDDVGGDFHCHTDLSPDGTAPLEVMVKGARARGYRFLAITDHGERLGLGGASRDQLLAQRDRIHALEARLGDITLLHGAELNIG